MALWLPSLNRWMNFPHRSAQICERRMCMCCSKHNSTISLARIFHFLCVRAKPCACVRFSGLCWIIHMCAHDCLVWLLYGLAEHYDLCKTQTHVNTWCVLCLRTLSSSGMLYVVMSVYDTYCNTHCNIHTDYQPINTFPKWALLIIGRPLKDPQLSNTLVWSVVKTVSECRGWEIVGVYGVSLIGTDPFSWHLVIRNYRGRSFGFYTHIFTLKPTFTNQIVFGKGLII